MTKKKFYYFIIPILLATTFASLESMPAKTLLAKFEAQHHFEKYTMHL